MRVPARRSIALVLLTQMVAGCATWSRPKSGVTPHDYVTQRRPTAFLVITTAGDTVKLNQPMVVGDSLVEARISMTWVDQPVSVARPADTDIVPVEADALGYRRIRVLTKGSTVIIDRPTVTADSITGTTKVQRAYRRGVPLAEVGQVLGSEVSGGRTTAAVVAAAVGIALVVSLVALATWDGPFGSCCQ